MTNRNSWMLLRKAGKMKEESNMEERLPSWVSSIAELSGYDPWDYLGIMHLTDFSRNRSKPKTKLKTPERNNG